MKRVIIAICSVVFLFYFDAYAGWIGKQLTDFSKAVKNLKPLNTPENDASVKTHLAQEEIVEGLKDALVVSVNRLEKKIGRVNGFLKNPRIHIPLPSELERAKDFLKMIGFDRGLSELEIKMNRAAEKATSKAASVFIKTIKSMSINDAIEILNGPDDAATEYFRKKMTPTLKMLLRPIIKRELYTVGAARVYQQVMNKIGDVMPFDENRKEFDLVNYTLNKTLDGIFLLYGL